MELLKEEIDLVKKSDAYYLLAVQGEEHFTSIDGIYNDRIKTIHKLIQALLGSLKNGMSTGNSNGVFLLTFIQTAINTFPELRKLLIVSEKN